MHRPHSSLSWKDWLRPMESQQTEQQTKSKVKEKSISFKVLFTRKWSSLLRAADDARFLLLFQVNTNPRPPFFGDLRWLHVGAFNHARGRVTRGLFEGARKLDGGSHAWEARESRDGWERRPLSNYSAATAGSIVSANDWRETVFFIFLFLSLSSGSY